MPLFRVAYTGDFLDANGTSAYGDIRLELYDHVPFLKYHFIREHAPHAGDGNYWKRFYSMEVAAEHLEGIDVIGRSGAGYDKIDLAACTENDVAVFNAPLALNHATASAALLLMLALAKNLPRQERITRAGRWDLQAEAMASEIEGRTLGIIGLGHSGRELVRLVAPFRMNLLGYSPHADPAQAAALGVRLTSLDELLRNADFVSLHCRLTKETRKILKAEQLVLMKPTAYLVNIARGELIDQAALVECLRARRIAGAGLDVFDVEPLPVDDPLLTLDNVIVTPHWLASSTDVWRATGQAMAEGMLRAATGQIPENVVNREVLNRPRFREKLSRFKENVAASGH
jgi:phosphoglycerate dehydrogenase-like enzyme